MPIPVYHERPERAVRFEGRVTAHAPSAAVRGTSRERLSWVDTGRSLRRLAGASPPATRLYRLIICPPGGRLKIGSPFSEEALSTERVERRLAAILAADVVGYSRLMGQDETGTLARLKALRRELIDPKITEHRGRIVKTTGDGVLAEFPSAVEAVTCAITVQRALTSPNETVPKDKRFTFRIGINVGDIIIEANDIFGDGVNVAARLEGLCEPGGVCISRAVRDQVRDKLPVSFDDLGEQIVKNIA